MFNLAQRIGIFCNTQEMANRIFDRLISEIDESEIQSIRRSRFQGSECILKGGTVIKALSVSENRRGMKFDKIYYDSEISPEIVDKVLYPCVLPSVHTLEWLGLD